MSEDRMVRLLELDLEHLHRTIDKFDNQRFAIRSWTVTTGGALLALSVSARNAGVPIVGLFIVAFFAYLEIVYMDMQVRVMSDAPESDSCYTRRSPILRRCPMTTMHSVSGRPSGRIRFDGQTCRTSSRRGLNCTCSTWG